MRARRFQGQVVLCAATMLTALVAASCGDDDQALAPQVAASVYGFANGCFAVERMSGSGPARFMARDTAGTSYAFSATQLAGATPFFLKPSALGFYLLFDDLQG